MGSAASASCCEATEATSPSVPPVTVQVKPQRRGVPVDGFHRRMSHQLVVKMATQRLILIRHGQSEGNINEALYCTTADNQVHLTRKGFQQAIQAGQSLKSLIGDETVRFFVSPYVRTRETFNGISKAWGGSESVKWSEDPRLREQEFGNFQEPGAMAKAKDARNRFGRFYYRFSNGESGADVYDRVSALLESLWRYWALHDYSNYVLVTHGLTIQLFLMRWFKYDVDQFHRYRNPDNCEYFVIEKDCGTFKLSYSQPLDGPKRTERVLLPEEVWNPRQINDDPPLEGASADVTIN